MEPWNENGRSWFTQNDGGDSLSEAFPGFWRLFAEEEWNDTIRRAIDWYLNSNNSAIHVGIVLAQAALEALSYKINQKKIRPIAKALKTALKEVGIDEEIPSKRTSLKAVAEQEKWRNSPAAIIGIRNEIVHAKKRQGDILVDVQLDCLHLSLWYIELMLLRKMEYRGRYKNRLIVGWENPFDRVPWVRDDDEAAK